MSAWCRPSAAAPPSWCWRSPGPSPSPHPRLHQRTQSLYLAELCMTSFTNLCNLLHTTLHLPILLKCGTRTPCNNVLCDKICGQKLQSCRWKYLVQSFSWFSSLKWTVWDLNVTFTLFYNLWCSKELQSVAAVTRQRSAGRGRGGNQWAAAAAARARHQTHRWPVATSTTTSSQAAPVCWPWSKIVAMWGWTLYICNFVRILL